MMDDAAVSAFELEFCGRRWTHHKRGGVYYVVAIVDVRTENGWEPGILYETLREGGSFVRTVASFRASFSVV